MRVVAEQHGISLEDAARMFTERFSPSTSGVKLDLRDTACGRGLVATGAIAEGETLLAVPWNQAIHVYEVGDEGVSLQHKDNTKEPQQRLYDSTAWHISYRSHVIEVLKGCLAGFPKPCCSHRHVLCA